MLESEVFAELDYSFFVNGIIGEIVVFIFRVYNYILGCY